MLSLHKHFKTTPSPGSLFRNCLADPRILKVVHFNDQSLGQTEANPTATENSTNSTLICQ